MTALVRLAETRGSTLLRLLAAVYALKWGHPSDEDDTEELKEAVGFSAQAEFEDEEANAEYEPEEF